MVIFHPVCAGVFLSVSLLLVWFGVFFLRGRKRKLFLHRVWGGRHFSVSINWKSITDTSAEKFVTREGTAHSADSFVIIRIALFAWIPFSHRKGAKKLLPLLEFHHNRASLSVQ